MATKDVTASTSSVIIPSQLNVNSTKEVEKVPSLTQKFVSGGIGGLNLVLVGHPFDVVKVVVQTKSTTNSSMYQVTKGLLKEGNGLKGLYRGVVPPLVGVVPIMATSFWGYALGQDLIKKFKKDRNEPLKFYELGLAGGFSALPSTILVAPGERIKCLLQVNEKSNQLIPTLKKVYQTGGIRSLFQGTWATLLRDVPACMVYFTSYDLLKSSWEDAGFHYPLLKVILCGGVAGTLNWLVCIPADVLKTKVQTSFTKLTITQAYNQMKDGRGGVPIRKLYSGLTPALLRAFPANAACFLGVELTLKLMN